MNPQTWWFVARAAGIVAWGLLTFNVLLGAVVSLGVIRRSARSVATQSPGATATQSPGVTATQSPGATATQSPSVTATAAQSPGGTATQSPTSLVALHRWLGALAVVFTAVHLVGLFVDSYVQFSLLDFVVPGASEWKPMPVALGVVGLWLLAAIEITSVLRRHLPRRYWKAIHQLSYVLFWVATLHGALAGTDATQPLYQIAALTGVWATMTVVIARVLTRRSVRRGSIPTKNRSRSPVAAP